MQSMIAAKIALAVTVVKGFPENARYHTAATLHYQNAAQWHIYKTETELG